jgi:hypothetical protein
VINRAIIAKFSFFSLILSAAFFLASAPAYAAGTTSTFSTNYQLWDASSDIRSLQQFFNGEGFVIAENGPGSPGNETSIFGLHTYQTLVEFQASHGLPATGFFGPLTRAFINSGFSTSRHRRLFHQLLLSPQPLQRLQLRCHFRNRCQVISPVRPFSLVGQATRTTRTIIRAEEPTYWTQRRRRLPPISLQRQHQQVRLI